MKIKSLLILLVSLNSFADDAKPFLKTLSLTNTRNILYSSKINPDLFCKSHKYEKSVASTYSNIVFDVAKESSEYTIPQMVTVNNDLKLEKTDFEYISHSPKFHKKSCNAWVRDTSESGHDWGCDAYEPEYWSTVYTIKVLTSVTCDTGLLSKETTISMPKTSAGDLLLSSPTLHEECKLLGFDIYVSHKTYEALGKKMKVAYAVKNDGLWSTVKMKHPTIVSEITCAEVKAKI